MGSNHVELFDKNVPTRVQRALTKLVLESSKQSSRYCYRNFAEPQAKDLSGGHRRAKIEDEFPGIAELFKTLGVKDSIEQYDNNTGSYHELTCGVVKLTESCVADDVVPRTAKFRSTLARDGQASFVWSEADEKLSGEQPKFLYALLTYGIDVHAPKRIWPAFIKVQFPNEDFTGYIGGGIDLFKRFPDLVAEYVPKPSFERQITKRHRRKASGE
jgi:hypothetical protein